MICNYHSLIINDSNLIADRHCIATLYNNVVEYDVYLQSNQKNNRKYIITCYDIFSNYGFSFEIKTNETLKNIVDNCQQIIKNCLNITDLKVLSF